MSRNPSEYRFGQLEERSSVAADMSARAAVSRAFAVTLCALVVVGHIVSGKAFDCIRDGFYTDYDRQCTEYVRCSNGTVTDRYSCPPELVFNEANTACVPRGPRPCTRRECDPTDTSAYASPGTACQQYYRCDNGTAIEHSCPPRAWFDLERQACTRGAGTCFEPVCAGLPDSDYPDPSHDCRRTLKCRGGELHTVSSCGSTCTSDCPPPRIAAVPLAAGDGDFCSDEACTSLCRVARDGAYADRTAGCREYFVCESNRVVRRGVCEDGRLFSNGACEPAARTTCHPPALSPCFNRRDGTHRDWRNCGSWFECRRERVVSRGSCAPGLKFDGNNCVLGSEFLCNGPVLAFECLGLPSGMYQDLSSNCTRYFHCVGALRTTLACPPGEVYDGASCTPASYYLCPSLDRESCYRRPDGRYRAADAECRGYYECFHGVKATYVCPVGQVFDGETCVLDSPGLCERQDYSCQGLSDGYHPDLESGCRRYFYCELEDRLSTLTCQGGKIFNGKTCTNDFQYNCGSPPLDTIENDGERCERDGFYVLQGTECKQYYFCVSGARTSLTCPTDQIFNGEICVPSNQYTCPG